MTRRIRFSEKLLIVGYGLILLFMIVQDWVPLGKLNDIQAIASEKTSGELLFVTLIGVIQIVLLIGLLFFFIGKRYPLWAKLWLLIHPACIFVGALVAWWIPYVFGGVSEEKKDSYTRMFGDTHSFLPIMNGIVPNTLHTFFHATLAVCILLTIYIFSTNRREPSS